jgi:type VI secretion system secreted protein VgrG
MAEFEPALEYVLESEGGFSDKPSDSGGATNKGISLRFLRSIPAERLNQYAIFENPTLNDIRNLTHGQVSLIYRREFWEHAPFQEITNQNFCNYIFSMTVLHGISQGIKLTQRAIWAVMGCKDYIADDGIMGRQTLLAINSFGFDRELNTAFTVALCAEHAGFCRLLAEIRPKDRENLNGWLNRCYRL